MPNRLTSPSLLLRAESLVLFVTAVGVYEWHDGSWWFFALIFLAPDLSFLAYLAGPRLAAAAYNLVHAFVLPGILLLIATTGSGLALDRLLGYGLNYPEGFKETHLGRRS
jgi:hypothetical protein